MVSDLLVRIRDTLSDPNGDRWSDARLIRLINQAQRDLTFKARLLRTKYEVPLFNNQAVYDLPDDVLFITRALYNDKNIEFKSHEEMDAYDETWEVATTDNDIKFIVYDKINRGQFKLYPIPNNLSASTYIFENDGYLEETFYNMDDFGVLTNVDSTGDIIEDTFGIVADVDLTVYSCDSIETIDMPLNNDFGIAGSIVDENRYFGVSDPSLGMVNSITDFTADLDYGLVGYIKDEGITKTIATPNDYGVTVDILDTAGALIIYYIRKPVDIVDITDSLDIDDIWETAIKYYVCGHALRDDMDTQNRQFGAEELQLYSIELKEAMENSSRDFTKSTQYKTKYRRL